MQASLTPELVRLREYLITQITNAIGDQPGEPASQRQTIGRMMKNIYAKLNLPLSEADRECVFRSVFDEMMGYGPIQPFLDDPQVAEIMVNGYGHVFIEKEGQLIETGNTFDNDQHVMRMINRMIHPLGRRVDADSPTVDARLPDGSRVNVVIPPVAVDGPCISIRKFLPNRMSMDELIGLGSLTGHMAEFLRACVVARLNILVTGGTSSGKTTMLNILSGYIPGNERIITIEDAVELNLKQRHIVRLETRPANVEGEGVVSTRDLVRNALRMRPDRIVVGEVRSGEALDMLQAMNTGHSGSLTTLHANSPRDALSRLETMTLMSGLELPLGAIRRQIASALNLIVHQVRLPDGTRKTAQITEIAGMESDIITLTDLFKFEQTGVRSDGLILGEPCPTGIRPQFTPRLEVVGYRLGAEIFGGPRAQPAPSRS